MQVVFVSTIKEAKGSIATCWGPFESDEQAKAFIIKQAAAGEYYLFSGEAKCCVEKPQATLNEKPL